MKTSLSLCAEIITQLSGHKITRDSLRNQIVRGRWPHKFYRERHNSPLMLERADVIKFAKTFQGIKIGRPKKIT